MTPQRLKALNWLREKAKPCLPIYVDRKGSRVCVGQYWRVPRPNKPDIWFLEDFTNDNIRRVCK